MQLEIDLSETETLLDKSLVNMQNIAFYSCTMVRY